MNRADGSIFHPESIMRFTSFCAIVLGWVMARFSAAPSQAQQVGGTDDKGGTVVITAKYGGKKKPDRREINVAADPFCQQVYQAKNMAGPLQEKWVWGKNDTLVNVFVKVEKGLGDRKFTHPKEPVRLAQVECVYVPHVVGVMTNQNLSVLNQDMTLHNVNAIGFAFPGPAAGQPVKGLEVLLPMPRKEDLISMRCDVHAWMYAHVHVVAHPYFAVTGADGTCSIRGLPAGDYELKVWHEFKTFVPDSETLNVKVKDGETTQATVTYAPKK